MPDHRWPLGVFASIDAGLGVPLDVARDLNVTTVHLHTPHRPLRTPQKAREFLRRLEELDITVTCVFAGFAGESYADIPTVQRSVGLVPAETRAARFDELCEIADFAKLLKVPVVGLHVGFVPHEPSDATYAEVIRVTRAACDHLAGSGQALHLETGQEPAEVLLRFLDDVGRDNLFVNFDPANMILYGVGQPLPALKLLGGRVRSVHCKDARWSDRPGQTWGEEVPLGEGDVDMEAYLRTLDQIGYTGPLTIEREIAQEPQRQKAEIGGALALLDSLKTKLQQ